MPAARRCRAAGIRKHLGASMEHPSISAAAELAAVSLFALNIGVTVFVHDCPKQLSDTAIQVPQHADIEALNLLTLDAAYGRLRRVSWSAI
jgi:hypothetical protein